MKIIDYMKKGTNLVGKLNPFKKLSLGALKKGVSLVGKLNPFKNLSLGIPNKGNVKVFLVVFLVVAMTVAVSAIIVSFIPTTETTATAPESTQRNNSESERSNTLAYLILWSTFLIVLFKTIITKIKSKKENNFRLTDQPVIQAIIGVIIVNTLISIAFPNVWSGFYESNTFWLINIALVIGYHFSKSDKVGKVVAIVTVLVVVAVLVGDINPFRNYSSTQPIVLQPSFQPDLPAEIALPIIANCESGGNHFKEDGVTPLKNKEGSSAIGKYQILTSTHEERAKSMGFDIKTPEGNEAYAKVLYSEPDGIKHWLADSRAKECIEKGLKGNFDSEYGKRVWKMVVEAPTEGWTTWYPAKYFDLSIEGEDRIKSSYKTEFVTTEGVVVTEAPRDLQKKIPGITEKYRFKSLENKPVKIIVTLTPYKAK